MMHLKYEQFFANIFVKQYNFVIQFENSNMLRVSKIRSCYIGLSLACTQLCSVKRQT